MKRVLLPLWLTMVVVAGPPPQTAAATPAPPPASPEPAEPAVAGTRMQTSLEKQRASIRKQITGWIAVGEAQPSDTFLLPWPKTAVTAVAATAANVALKTILDSIPCDAMAETELDGIVQEAANRQNVTSKLIRAIITQESGGRPCAVSAAGAQGLMQLMPEVQRELAVSDPFDPKASVEAGAKLLRTLIDRYAGNLPKALAAYNAGPAAVDRAGGIPPIPETTNYVAKIVKRIE